MNKGIANPMSLILSTAMLLDWLKKQKGQEIYVKANQLIFKVVENLFRRK